MFTGGGEGPSAGAAEPPEVEHPVNPARQLERLLEDVLAQRIFAVDFAWGFTLLERHLAGARGWVEGLDGLEPARELQREQALGALSRMDEAMARARAFVEEGDLADLDRALAAARQAAWSFEEVFAAARDGEGVVGEIPARLRVEPRVEREWQREWSATVTRHQGESRATFRCKECGWEFSYVEEAPAGELEVPFSSLACPLCHPAG